MAIPSRPLLFHGGLLLDPEHSEPERGSLLVAQGRIAARLRSDEEAPVAAERVDLAGACLSPGFLDVHYHGGFIFDASRIDDALESGASMSRHGVTGYLPTTVAWPSPELLKRVEALAQRLGDAADALPAGAVPLGLHLEGPWINAEAAGAQPSHGIRPCDLDEARQILDATSGLTKLVTLAPEIPGSHGLLELLQARGIPAALGHSTADLETANDAVRRGARHVTHLFNAMGAFHHRDPGLAGAALSNDLLTADLICDGAHVHPAVVRIAARALGDRLLLVTDRIEPPQDASSFGSGGLHDDGVALRLPGGELAGSRVTLDRALQNAIEFAELSLIEAVAACTLRPARLLGIESERGTLRPGARADLVALDATGRVLSTWIAGRSCSPN